MLFLSGGTGTPKLLRGIKEIIEPEEIHVIANTADDIWITNTYVSPDIDTLLYLFSDQIDDEKWWGIRKDTFKTNKFLKKLGHNEYMDIGDKDRAIHLIRTKLLKENKNLTEVTEHLSKKLGIKQEIIPMTNDKVDTIIKTENDEEMHFQRWWINNRDKEIKKINFKGLKKSKPSNKFKKQINNHKKIIIGPSNPVTSIYPIISLKGIKEELKKKETIAISPFVGKGALSGPANKLMKTMGYEPTIFGLHSFYQEFLDTIIADNSENKTPKNTIKTDIIMKNKKEEKKLAKFLINNVI